MSALPSAVARRRTFAIIAHPDAGKTTLTEKLLLYGGAIQLAGAVKAKRARAHAVSDWMEMERERGISISTSVLQFPYKGRLLSLVDTPGHADFSEDTYRAPMEAVSFDAPELVEALDDEGARQLREDIELIEAAGDALDRDKLARGEVTPMFFGSAITNFGLPQFLDAFIELMPPPAPRRSD